jgi:hypothetical protein
MKRIVLILIVMAVSVFGKSEKEIVDYLNNLNMNQRTFLKETYYGCMDRGFVAVSFQEAGRGESLQVLKEKIAQLKFKGLGPWASSIAKVLANVTDAIYMGADKYQQNFDNKQFKQGYSFSVNSLTNLLNDKGINAESDARSQTVRIVNKTTDFDVVISLLIDNDLISRSTSELPVVIRSSTVLNGKASTKKLGSFVLDLSSETSRGKAATSSILRRANSE